MKLPTPSLLYLMHFTSLLLILSKSTQPPFSCDSSGPRTKSYPFCKTTLLITQRVQELVSRLSLDEKISQLVNSAPAILRLSIPEYQWWSEALHGVVYSWRVTQGIRFNGTIRSATSFPQVILTAKTFDAHLWYHIGQASPLKDPRWGRGQETLGEDPLVTGKYAVSFVRGLQGDSFEGGKPGEHLQASACCKHFTAYDLDNWKGMTRYVFNAKVSLQDLADTYQPPFKSCVQQGKTSGIMCAYNHVNGVPNCADYDLLSKTARGQWGFNQGYAKLPEDVVADVLKAGMDVNCGTYLKKYTKSTVVKRKLHVSEIDRALHNLFSVRIVLGFFNGSPVRQHFVGNYACPPCKPVTPLQGLKNYVRDIRYQGCAAVNCSSPFTTQAVNIAKGADHVVLVMGLDQTQEREDHDRVDLILPPKQQNMVSAIARVAKNPIIFVFLSGGSVDISFSKSDKCIGSILWAGYLSEAGGRALAEIIFGDHNPGGRLPVTWYLQSYIKIPMTDMRMCPEPSSSYPGCTYRFYQGPKVFEFGYDLSYSNYVYQFLPVAQNKAYFNNQASS
ncbi:hypothetical protein V6N13_065546 [Hibiscus sabdariffa]